MTTPSPTQHPSYTLMVCAALHAPHLFEVYVWRTKDTDRARRFVRAAQQWNRYRLPHEGSHSAALSIRRAMDAGESSRVEGVRYTTTRLTDLVADEHTDTTHVLAVLPDVDVPAYRRPYRVFREGMMESTSCTAEGLPPRGYMPVATRIARRIPQDELVVVSIDPAGTRTTVPVSRCAVERCCPLPDTTPPAVEKLP